MAIHCSGRHSDQNKRVQSAKFSLLSLVDVQSVTTNKGQRTFKKRAQQTGFTKVGEVGKS